MPATTALTYTFPDFQIDDLTCSDVTFSYSAMLSNTSALPSFISFDAITRTFTVFTNTALNNGTYGVTVTGTLNNGQNLNSTFNINVINTCEPGKITAAAMSDQYYYLDSGP